MNKQQYAKLTPEQLKVRREKNKLWMKKWAKEHREKSRARSLLNYQKHKKKRIAKISEWKRNNREKMRGYEHRAYHKGEGYMSKERIRTKQNEKYKNNPLYRLKNLLSRSLRQSLKLQGFSKKALTLSYLGCDIKQLKTHLESQFKKGMTWDNHKRDGWHVDHIRPVASFDLSKEEEILKCYHYTNLQPLWAEENLKKGKTYEKKN